MNTFQSVLWFRAWLLPGLVLLVGVATSSADEPSPIRVVVWDEQQPSQKEAYENFLGNAIANHLSSKPGITVKSVRMDDPSQGLPPEVLDACDVLIWWGHVRQAEVKPELAGEIVKRVNAGSLSLIALHSAHWSEPFVQAMRARAVQDTIQELLASGETKFQLRKVTPPRFEVPKRGDPLTPRVTKTMVDGKLQVELTLPMCIFPAYRSDGKASHVKILRPDHPTVVGLPATFDIAHTEMYDEPFHVPEPDEVILEETWDAGERFRSLCVWNLGRGKVVYFRPGHETFPVFKQPEPLKILENTVRWLGQRP